LLELLNFTLMDSTEGYQRGRNFGHVINRSPDKISIELLQKARRWHLQNRGFLWKNGDLESSYPLAWLCCEATI
jgi:hypothetical protein